MIPPALSIFHPDRGPWSPRIRRERALQELSELSELLAARGQPPLQICLGVLYRAEQLGATGAELPPDLPVQLVRRLPGLRHFDPLADWQESLQFLPADAADTIDPPTRMIVRRRRRAHALGGWLYRHGETQLAEKITNTAEALGVAELRDILTSTTEGTGSS